MAKSNQASNLIYLLQVNDRIIHKQLDGLSHDDLLLQPDMRGNCANWILGHIIENRHGIMKRLDLDPIWSEEERSLYGRESEPITGTDSPHLPMEKLLADLKITEEKIVTGLENVTDEELVTEISEGRTLGRSLIFAIWHEGYHVGQFEYLRQLTGVDDKVRALEPASHK